MSDRPSHGDERGHASENNFFDALELLAVTRLDSTDEKPNDWAYVVATEEQDADGVDCFLYNPSTKQWTAVDLTTNSNSKTLAEKRFKEKVTNAKVLQLPEKLLDNAARGAEVDLKKLITAIKNITTE